MLTEYHSGIFSYKLTNWSDDGRNRVTAIIGANGSGKSRLLSHIASAYVEDDEKTDKWESRLNDTYRSTVVSDPWKKSHSNLLAVSNLITDTFPFTRSLNERYKYLGHRRGASMFSTGSLNHLMISSILDLHQEPSMLKRYQGQVHRELEIGNFGLYFKSSSRKDIYGSLKDKLEKSQIPQSIRHRLSRQTGFESINSTSLMNSFIEQLTNWVLHLNSHDPKRENKYTIDDFHVSKFIYICDDFKLRPSAVNNLLKRSGVGAFDLFLTKELRMLKFENLSTGEQLLLSTIARIAANITKGSLVLVDEPEVGLHPNWQQRFPRLMVQVLPKNFGCHFLVATHSPFIASEADDVLVPGESLGSFVEYPDSIAARSIDDILYRVFGARISGNTAVQRDVQLLLNQLSGTEKYGKEELRRAYSRLSKITDEDATELNLVLSEIREEL